MAACGARAAAGAHAAGWRVLMPFDENDPFSKPRLSAFTQALEDLGWADGRNVRIDVWWAGDDPNRIRALAQELVGQQPDVIMAPGTLVTAAVQRETRISRSSLRAWPTPSPAASSRGSTARVGTSPASLSWRQGGKWLELLSEIAPGLKRAHHVQSRRGPRIDFYALT